MKLKTVCLGILLGFLLFSCDKSKRETVFHPSHLEQKKNAPFSDAVEANGFLFLAGQIGYDYSKGKMAEGGIKGETSQAIANIKAVLEYHKLSTDDVVKCTVILSDINDFAAFNEVYTKHFTRKPARTTYAAKGLARNSLIEIDVIAVQQ